MNEVVLYLLESSAILGMLYLVYYLVLRKEASFNFNRFFLLGSLVISFLLPLLSLDFDQQKGNIVDKPIIQLTEVRNEYQRAVKAWSSNVFDQDVGSAVAVEKSPFLWKSFLLKSSIILYAIGVIALICRLIWTVSWVMKLKNKHPHEIVEGVRVVKVPYQLAPFSFLNMVFVSTGMRESDEFFHILEHEKAHIRQRHSLDLLFVQFLAAILWFNPVIWWLTKSLKTTHEYIADRKMIKLGYSLVEYQTLLLRQLISNNSFGLVHNFNLSFIKKRITMMKIERLGSFGKFKVASVILLTALFSMIIVQCNSKLDDQEVLVKEPNTGIHADIQLPTVVATGYVFDSKSPNAFYISIKDNQIALNGKVVQLEDLKSMIEVSKDNAPVYMRIASDQPMKMVYEVQEELRRLELRKMIYLAKTESGSYEQIHFMLPPVPGSNSGIIVPELTEEFIKENNIDLLKVDLGGNNTQSFEEIDNLVREHMKKEIPGYVIEGQFRDSDTYGQYLSNLQLVKKVFYDIYEERAQEMFGRGFMEINRERKTSEEAGKQYNEVRQGIPMSITTSRI